MAVEWWARKQHGLVLDLNDLGADDREVVERAAHTLFDIHRHEWDTLVAQTKTMTARRAEEVEAQLLVVTKTAVSTARVLQRAQDVDFLHAAELKIETRTEGPPLMDPNTYERHWEWEDNETLVREVLIIWREEEVFRWTADFHQTASTSGNKTYFESPEQVALSVDGGRPVGGPYGSLKEFVECFCLPVTCVLVKDVPQKFIHELVQEEEEEDDDDDDEDANNKMGGPPERLEDDEDDDDDDDDLFLAFMQRNVAKSNISDYF